jgi:hypothetical protein
MPDFVTLTCPTCGGKLEITDDIERFACGYCGCEHVVRRGGGIVALIPIADDIKGIKTGVDKTSAELGIIRLRNEIDEMDTLIAKAIENFFYQFEEQGSRTGLVFEVGYSIELLFGKKENVKFKSKEIKVRINAINRDDINFLVRSLPQFNNFPRFKESVTFQVFLSELNRLQQIIRNIENNRHQKKVQLEKLLKIANE